MEQRRDRRQHARARDRRERGDSQRARELELGGPMPRGRQVVEELGLERALHLAIAEQARARFGGAHARRAPHEEPLFQLGLELLDPLRESGLRDVEAGRRPGEAPGRRDSMEGVELMGREGHSKNLSAYANLRLVL